jgi:hypothetical protein
MQRDQRIYGLESYGLTRPALHRLKSTPVSFSVQLKGRPLFGLLKFAPHQRDSELRNTLASQLQRLIQRFPDATLKSRDERRASWTADGVLPAQRISALAASPELQYVSIHAINGRRKRPLSRETWFCVWGLVVIQIEGRDRGMVDVEDRLVLVKARDRDHARKKLRRDWHDYGEPYLNPYGYLVRWRLVSVVDVYDTNLDSIDPDGAEVYSRIRAMRMKPEYRWLPKRWGV